jgi:glycine/D-amino acid oxidase-like deaminating enzyme
LPTIARPICGILLQRPPSQAHRERAIELEVAYRWAGTFGETKDGLAYIGQVPQMPRCYFVLGFGGNGITYSLIASEIVRDALIGRSNADARLFRFDR